MHVSWMLSSPTLFQRCLAASVHKQRHLNLMGTFEYVLKLQVKYTLHIFLREKKSTSGRLVHQGLHSDVPVIDMPRASRKKVQVILLSFHESLRP